METKNSLFLIEGYSYQVNPSGTIDEIILEELLRKGNRVHFILNGFSFDKQLDEVSINLKKKGVEKVLYLRNFYFNPLVILKTTFVIFKMLIKKKNLVDFKIKGILIGDAIYDGILRHDKKLTIDNYSLVDYWRWVVGILDYFSTELIRINNYSALFSSHLVYGKFVILARLFWSKKIPVILLNPTGMHLYSNFDKGLYTHNRNYSINKIINDLDNKELNDSADKMLHERIHARTQHFDVKNSFGGEVLSKSDLSKTINVNLKQRFIVVIAAHAFKDGPHDSENLLFRDYYDWFVSTLKIISKIKNKRLLFLIKPHPSAEKYEELGLTESLLSSYTSKENMRLIPSGISSKSIIAITDLVITSSGTIGIEFACFGIPCITAGTPFYSNFGFSVKASSLLEYKRIINMSDQFTKLSNHQIKIAKLLFLHHIQTTAFLPSPMLTGNKVSISPRNRNIINNRLKQYLEAINN